MRQNVVRKAVLFLASVALASVALGGVAAAHPLQPKPFESDITEDKIISFCNPDAVRPVLFEEAIADWNSYAVDDSAPVIVDVTDSEGAFCELRPDRQGGDSADYLAQVDFNAHPDSLDISSGFGDLERDQRGATLRHELGHAVGLGHNEMCAKSVMPTLEFCNKNGTPRRLTVGPHDAEDRLEYWNGATAIYPVPYPKCWTNEDADSDGVCDRYGPPNVGLARTMRAQPADATPVKAPPNLVN